MKCSKRLNLSLVTMMAVTLACNEKISPELNPSSSTTVPSPTTTTEHYFRVVNTSDTMLNYKLHRTGPSNATTDCEISSTTAFDQSYYSADLNNTATEHYEKTYDISCFFEAEEMALYMNGLEFQVEASPDACAYVSYTPFSFYDWMPGDSSASVTKVTCDGTANDADVPASAPDYNANWPGAVAATNQPCNTYVDSSVALTDNRTTRASTDDDAGTLCNFDYTASDGPNCDTGVITLTTIAVSETAPAAATTTTTTTTIRCGGSAASCVKGPIRDSGVIPSSWTYGSEVMQSTSGASFAKEYSYAGIIGNGGNRKYVNFRRGLALLEGDYGDESDDFVAALGGVGTYDPTEFTDTRFDPAIMENYARNRYMDGTARIVPGAVGSAGTYLDTAYSNGFTAFPLAAEAFVGLTSSGVSGNRVNPFYTFHCLDRAKEIKARIRMVVRDWDRQIPTTTLTPNPIENMSDLVSSIGATNDSYLDVHSNNDEEVTNDPDSYNGFNDLGDWDDTIPMSRSAGAYNAGTTLWNPANGNFDLGNFTWGDY